MYQNVKDINIYYFSLKIYFRLPQSVYETAKVSKILLAINSGKAHLFKGKTLDEIEVAESDDITVDTDSDKDEITSEPVTPNISNKLNAIIPQNDNSPPPAPDVSGFSSTSKVNFFFLVNYGIVSMLILGENVNTSRAKPTKIERIRWTEEQKQIIKNHFKNHIKKKQAPRKNEVEKLIENHVNLFKDKNWVKIKAYVYNCYKDH